MPDLDINFQFIAHAQALEAGPAQINAIGDNYARLIVDEVAIAASTRTLQKAKTSFVKGVRDAIKIEVNQMANLIGRFLPLPDKYTGPNGQMSLGQMSATGRQFGFQQTFERKSTNIDWAARSQKYLRWKRRLGLPDKWWSAGYGGVRVKRNQRTLQQYLMSKKGAFYESSFGPIRVTFTPAPAVRNQGKFAAARSTTPAVHPDDVEGGATKRTNIAATGRPGKLSTDYRIGTLSVDVFGKITPSMLPGLSTMDPTRADAYPSEGVVGLFPDDGKHGQRVKLLGTRAGQHYRYAVEPFVSYYLTRAIPNAVWRRTERLIGNA